MYPALYTCVHHEMTSRLQRIFYSTQWFFQPKQFYERTCIPNVFGSLLLCKLPLNKPKSAEFPSPHTPHKKNYDSQKALGSQWA